MTNVAALTDPRIRLTLDELSGCQRLAGKHITFSMTLACPLKCSHCIVDAGPQRRSTTMPLEIAQAYGAQMPELAAYGIEGVCFTGGEPTLARQQVLAIARAAAANGIVSSLVTAAQWAATPAQARDTVATFDAIANWDVSFDVYHLPWVGFAHIRHAYEAVRAAGRGFTLRFTYTDPPSPQELELMALIEGLEGARVAAQRVRAVGRGGELALAEQDRYNPWIKPCLTQGMVVRYDGSIAPCCLNLVESRRHPFRFGDARTQPLVEAHRAFMRDPLLQLIRSLGFGQLQVWLEEAGLDRLLPEQLPDEACELCTLMLQDARLSAFLAAKAAEPANRLRIGLISARTLGETALLRQVLAEGAPAASADERALLEGFAASA